MPLHRIYHPPTAFSTADKKLLSERITSIYVSAGLPPFYVVVIFIPIPSDSFYTGGSQTSDKFVRITIEHIARNFATSTPDVDAAARRKKAFLDKYDEALAPLIKDRGLDWETHVLETERELWRVNGIDPPMPGTEEEALWVRENRPVPYL